MTIRELAKKLGLGKSTVSDALRGNSSVSSETRDWVRKKALELGYKPNPMASAFLQQIRSKSPDRYRANLAFLTQWNWNEVHPFFKGASDRARELGYSLDKINARELDSSTLTRVLLARGVLGLAVSPLVRPIGHMSLDWSKFASVAMGYTMVRPAMHRVVHNHLQGIRTAFRMCQRKGFSRIGLALRTTEGDKRSNEIWSAGFSGLQQKLPASRRVRPLLTPDAAYTPESISRWLRKERPEAVIFHNAAVIPKLSEFSGGVRSPIVPVVLDRLPGDPYMGIDQQYERWGGLLIDLLSLQILHNQRGLPSLPTITMIDGRWMEYSE